MAIDSTKSWVRFSLLNLLIVATIGVLMRYKIGFEFPAFDQKHLQYAHSHFAFCGWISQTLFVLILWFIKPFISTKRVKSYHVLLLLNLTCAYVMLVSFAITGYGLLSIIFSTLSVLVSFAFVFLFLKDFKRMASTHPSILWFKAALYFNLISSFGTFALSYMMATKNIPQHAYLASVYWYLHFQYNGWFFFACGGLFIAYLKNSIPSFSLSNVVFWLFALSCIPAYGLSTLWLNLSWWIYLVVVLGAVMQFAGWIHFAISLKRISFLKEKGISLLGRFLFGAIALAITVKLGLQLVSTIPAISKLAFGFRPIVIAYLHLVLLAITSVFLLTWLYVNNLMVINKIATTGLVMFGTAVFVNELALAVQGIASLSYYMVPYINGTLFVISLFLFTGLCLLVANQFPKRVIN